MKKSIALLAAVGALLVAGSAQAQEFGTRGQMAFSADRLFGFYGYKATTTWDTAAGEYESSVSGSQLSLLWGTSGIPGAGQYGGFAANPYTIPRLSFDYFVIDSLSIGGSIGYAKHGGEVEQEVPNGNRAKADLNDRSMFVIAPRVGYAIMFNDWVGFWPRGGFTYATLNEETDAGDEDGYDVFSLDLEAMFVFIPKEHFAFTVGPVLDLGITGGYENRPRNNPTEERDVRLHTYGIAAGIMGYF